MVNKSLRTIFAISDGVRFSYSASLEVRVVPLGVLITYKYVRCRHWFQFQSTVDGPKLSRKQSRPQIVERRLFSHCYTLYKNINAIFRRNSKLMVALSFSVYFTATRFIAGIKCRKINASPFRTYSAKSFNQLSYLSIHRSQGHAHS